MNQMEQVRHRLFVARPELLTITAKILLKRMYLFAQL